MKPALLVVDIQNAFFDIDPETTQSLNHAMEYINEAIRYFREKDLPIIAIQHINNGDGLVPGRPGFDLPENLHILPTDVHIHKTYSNAFRKTDLESMLRELGVDTVIVTGFLAEGCVLSTARGGSDLDFVSIILRSAIASGSMEHKRFVEEVSEIISYKALRKVLEQF